MSNELQIAFRSGLKKGAQDLTKVAISPEEAGIKPKRIIDKMVDQAEESTPHEVPENVNYKPEDVGVSEQDEAKIEKMIRDRSDEEFAIRHPYLTGIPTLGIAPSRARSRVVDEVTERARRSGMKGDVRKGIEELERKALERKRRKAELKKKRQKAEHAGKDKKEYGLGDETASMIGDLGSSAIQALAD